MKLDYSKKYIDRKRHAVLKGITTAGDELFWRKELPNGHPLTWEEIEEGKGFYARWKPVNTMVVTVLEKE